MKILKILYPICFILFIGACSKNDRNYPASLVFPEGDTIVNTLPVNYLKNINNIDDPYKMEITSHEDMLELFDTLNYTPEAWQSGIREIPRVYLTIIGDRWGTTTTKEIKTEIKKRLFFRGLTPLILKSNELIMKDRKRLKTIQSAFKKNGEISELDEIWITKLATLYKVKSDEENLTQSMLDELWIKVDIIPVSLALGQSAMESGWGTSRFAAEGNAMYGQWAWGENAMTPEKQRKHLGNYGVATFESLQESVCAYMLNLNTHNAYADLRSKRAELRKNGKKITGPVLAETLIRYSERGESYVKEIKSMMEYNRLIPTDDAYLSKDSPIFLIPVAE